MAIEVADIIDNTSCHNAINPKETRKCEGFKRALYENFRFIVPVLNAGNTTGMTASWRQIAKEKRP